MSTSTIFASTPLGLEQPSAMPRPAGPRAGESARKISRGRYPVTHIQLPIRQCRLSTDTDVPCREENFTFVARKWSLPVGETAFVLVDCWDRHYIDSHLERNIRVVEETLHPALQACRQAGIAVVHAPSPPTARHYPQWTRYADDETIGEPVAPILDWPPEQLRSRSGKYVEFAPLPEKRQAQIKADQEERRITPLLAPQPEEYVVATGEQLHRLCRHLGIVHLIYAGFAANICMLYRDYGIRAMSRDRLYNVIVVRDCTIAVEIGPTVDDQLLLKTAIYAVEMNFGAGFGASTTSKELIAACEGVPE